MKILATRSVLFGTSALIALAFAASVYLWAQKPTGNAPTKLHGRLESEQRSYGENSHKYLNTKTAPSDSRSVESKSYKAAFANSRNYWKYAHEILADAKAGDSDAQFYLYKMLEYCGQANQAYFSLDGKKLSLDESLQIAAQQHMPIDLLQLMFDRCNGFQDEDAAELGTALEWLAKATAAGQPLAQASTAQKILMQNLLHGVAQASGQTNGISSDPIGDGANPHDLLRAAVESKDPEVFFTIGVSQNLLNPTDSNNDVNRFAWLLLACQRGYDCSSNAEWIKEGGSCINCDTNSPTDLVRGISGEQWPSVQQRALEIATKLDAGKWDSLGI